jgi:SAM-dependent methyltransferase
MFMRAVPYGKWAGFIESRWAEEGLSPNLVLDLCCGTGEMCLRLAREGRELIGVDFSEDMLAVAREKLSEAGLNVLLINQDMRELDLYGTVDAVICCCDSLNYLLAEADLKSVFKLVHNYLNPGGIFIFDINTPYKFTQVLGNGSFSDTADDAAFICENYYDAESHNNEYQVTFFIKTDAGVYERFEEMHVQHAYSIEELRGDLAETGFMLNGLYDADTFQAPTGQSERIFFVAKAR